MPMLNLISEFGLIQQLASRYNSEVYVLNTRLSERDNIQTLYDYRKVKATFRELKAAMTDLERSIDKISSEIPSLPPDHGTGSET